jgi:hypothetical protein
MADEISELKWTRKEAVVTYRDTVTTFTWRDSGKPGKRTCQDILCTSRIWVKSASANQPDRWNNILIRLVISLHINTKFTNCFILGYFSPYIFACCRYCVVGQTRRKLNAHDTSCHDSSEQAETRLYTKRLAFAIETLVLHIYKSIPHPPFSSSPSPAPNMVRAGQKPDTRLSLSSAFKNSAQYMAKEIRSLEESYPHFHITRRRYSKRERERARERKFDYSHQHENSAGPTISWKVHQPTTLP